MALPAKSATPLGHEKFDGEQEPQRWTEWHTCVAGKPILMREGTCSTVLTTEPNDLVKPIPPRDPAGHNNHCRVGILKIVASSERQDGGEEVARRPEISKALFWSEGFWT